MGSIYLTDNEIKGLRYCFYILSSLSIIACIIIIIFNFLKRELKGANYRNLTFLVFCEIFYLLSFFIRYDKNYPTNNNCIIQSHLINLFEQLKSYLEIYICYICLISRLNTEHLSKHKLKYKIFIYFIILILALLSNLILYIYDIIGNNGYYCHISIDDYNRRFYTFHILLYVLLEKYTKLYIILFLILKEKKFYKFLKINKKYIEKNDNEKFILFPFYYLFVNIILSFNIIYHLRNYNKFNINYEIINMILISTEGIIMLLLFINLPTLKHILGIKKKKKKFNNNINESRAIIEIRDIQEIVKTFDD
jgi:hypothetical protein